MGNFELRASSFVFVPAQSSWADGWLGLRELSWATPDASLGWAHPLPAWVWALLAVGACLFAGWSYSRLLGPRPVRIVLAGLRGLVILAVAVLLAGPVLIDPEVREEPDALVMLVDRSASMTLGDVLPAAGGGPITRNESLRRALVSQSAVFGDRGLGAGARRMVWLGFGGRVHELPPLTDESAWGTARVRADAPATALRTAVEQALRVAPGRPLAGVILFSDGRSPQPTGADLVRQVARRGTRVYVVPLGPAEPGVDLVLERVEAPERAFIRDRVPVTVRVGRVGGGDAGGWSARVRLVDAATDEVVDERVIEAERIDEPVRLTARSERVGKVRYRVEVVYEPADPAAAHELVTSNNAEQIVIDMIDRPVRVLYIEGYPRWEYRYLKNLLVREESIDSSILLLSADQAFAQEGDSPITRPPATAREVRPYDVVILGDVPPGYFTPEQLTLIRDHVAASGAGLLWIGGVRSTPGAYADTPLADLLPMRSPASVVPAPEGALPLEMRPTPLADALSVLQLRGPGDAASAEFWPAELPPLRWAQNLGPLKPTAEVLARAGRGPEAMPLLVRLRFGSGQSLYLATDETWRWRYGRGELYFEQFWVQLVRMLGRGRVQQAVDRARLSVSPRRVDVGEPVVVELTIEDAALLERQLPRVAVSVTRAPAAGEGEAASPGAAWDRVQLLPVTGDDGQAVGGQRVYRALWRPAAAGDLVLRVTEPALDALGLVRPLEVVAPDDEMRQAVPDHARLAALAAATGGEVIPLDHLERLLPVVPNLAEKTAIDSREPLWNSWLALMVVLGLLTTEWVIRKVIWLV